MNDKDSLQNRPAAPPRGVADSDHTRSWPNPYGATTHGRLREARAARRRARRLDFRYLSQDRAGHGAVSRAIQEAAAEELQVRLGLPRVRALDRLPTEVREWTLALGFDARTVESLEATLADLRNDGILSGPREGWKFTPNRRLSYRELAALGWSQAVSELLARRRRPR